MPSVTSLQNLPVALAADLAFAESPRALAYAVDALLPSYDVGFAAGRKPESFRVRQTANSPTVFFHTDVIDWITPNVTAAIADDSVAVSSSIGKTAWLVGAFIPTATTAGSPVAGTVLRAIINWFYIDPITGAVVQGAFGSSGAETNSSGDYFCPSAVLVGAGLNFSALINYTDGATTKVVGNGAMLWGFEIGSYS